MKRTEDLELEKVEIKPTFCKLVAFTSFVRSSVSYIFRVIMIFIDKVFKTPSRHFKMTGITTNGLQAIFQESSAVSAQGIALIITNKNTHL